MRQKPLLVVTGRTRRRPQTKLDWPATLTTSRTRYSSPGVTVSVGQTMSVRVLVGVTDVVWSSVMPVSSQSCNSKRGDDDTPSARCTSSSSTLSSVTSDGTVKGRST
ncbi:hypothetical protein WME76_02350 [Sorangium sp. So ce119]|uniref:hypothetical protein n=1 Tax=Sorangium sp. So ce119 TaxID=3133279 RepID=UPI003F63F15D